jgi:hypothetical protein
MMRLKYVIFALIALSLLVFSVPAYAAPDYQASVTPTPTRDPRTPPAPPAKSTPDIAQYNLDCPVGLPAGWGTVEPDPSWLVTCSHCLPTPTVYPTYDFGVPDLLSCLSGDLFCQSRDGSLHLGGDLGRYPQIVFSFHLSQDAMVYIRIDYAGFGLEGVDASRVGVLRYVVDGGDHYPLPYTEYGYHDIGLSLLAGDHYIAIFTTNPTNDVIVWGCSEVYVSLSPISANKTDCLGRKSCQVNLTSTVTLDSYSTYLDPANSASTVDCRRYLNGLRCDYDLHIQSLSYLAVYGGFRVDLHFSAPVQHYYLVGAASLCGGYPSGGDGWGVGGRFGGLAYRGTEAGAGPLQGYCPDPPVYYVYDWVPDPNNNPSYTYIGLASAADSHQSTSHSGWFVIMPEPYQEDTCSDPGSGVPVDTSSDGGSFCASVLPVADSYVPDLVIMRDTGNIACVDIPYLSASQFVPDWLETLLSGSDFWQFVLHAYLPASKICVRFYDISDPRFFGIRVPIGAIFIAFVGSWIFSRLLHK